MLTSHLLLPRCDTVGVVLGVSAVVIVACSCKRLCLLCLLSSSQSQIMCFLVAVARRCCYLFLLPSSLSLLFDGIAWPV